MSARTRVVPRAAAGDAAEQARRALVLVVDRLGRAPDAVHEPVVLTPSMVVRGTSGPPRPE
ncbi:hypothetical protein [Nocardiopsis sp. NRRL B-16309]|uniref:hypothetical protein n=1 Tax=Nocardiopsis sp. NRRL B-16309 TaxID=1519494 RepID=UPI0006AFCDC0|nr:hypothetical protein [Nocardiopsis sp. NRRL B-16309]KOX17035.1 hypothetical protein ADL05_10705 [Nocardiopsis sp. NRRL B-16309]